MRLPTPDGVPVKMRSPGRSGQIADSRAIVSGIEKSIAAVGELVRRDEPRTGGAEAGERLAEAELRRRSRHLDVARGDVLADGHTGDVRPAVRRLDAMRVPADDRDELHLPVNAIGRDRDVGARP